jgi:DNA-binding NarL/FixJ family response regulator
VRGHLRAPTSARSHALTSARRARVLLADDHRLVAEGLKGLLEAEFELVAMVEDGRAMVAAARALRPDVVVADISMPELNGIDALVELRRADPQARVVFLTMHQDPVYARRALDAGAAGYVLKHSAPGELIAAIRAALAGRTFVTPLRARLVRSLRHGGGGERDPVAALPLRQREVLQLLAEGKSAKEIGSALAISARTVEFHKYQAMETLGVHTNAELIHFAIKQGLVQI